MSNNVQTTNTLKQGLAAIDALTKVMALIEAAQFLTATEDECDLRSDLMDAAQGVIRRAMGSNL